MRATLLLATLALASGCSLLGADDEIVVPLYARGAEVRSVEGRAVTFRYATVLTGCVTFDGVRTYPGGDDLVVVEGRGRQRKGDVCLTVEVPSETDVRLTVLRPGRYTFHFLTGPRGGLDVEVDVP